MPTLQVRDLPEDVYLKLSLVAKQENRSLAQQTIVLLKESLSLDINNKIRRQALLTKLVTKKYPKIDIDANTFIKKDRER